MQQAKNRVQSIYTAGDTKVPHQVNANNTDALGYDRAVRVMQLQEGQEITLIHNQDYLSQK